MLFFWSILLGILKGGVESVKNKTPHLRFYRWADDCSFGASVDAQNFPRFFSPRYALQVVGKFKGLRRCFGRPLCGPEPCLLSNMIRVYDLNLHSGKQWFVILANCISGNSKNRFLEKENGNNQKFLFRFYF